MPLTKSQMLRERLSAAEKRVDVLEKKMMKWKALAKKRQNEIEHLQHLLEVEKSRDGVHEPVQS